MKTIKKQQFVAPAIKVVKMNSEHSIMAASGETPDTGSGKFKAETMTGGTFDWGTGSMH